MANSPNSTMRVINKKSDIAQITKNKIANSIDKIGRQVTNSVYASLDESDTAHGAAFFKHESSVPLSAVSGALMYAGTSTQYKNSAHAFSDCKKLGGFAEMLQNNGAANLTRNQTINRNGVKTNITVIDVKGRNDFKTAKTVISDYCKSAGVSDITKMTRSELRQALRTGQFGEDNKLTDAAKFILKNGKVDNKVASSRKLAGKKIGNSMKSMISTSGTDTGMGTGIMRVATKSGKIALKTFAKTSSLATKAAGGAVTATWHGAVKLAKVSARRAARVGKSAPISKIIRKADVKFKRTNRKIKRVSNTIKSNSPKAIKRKIASTVSAGLAAFSKTKFGTIVNAALKPFKAFGAFFKLIRGIIIKISVIIGIALVGMALISSGMGAMFAENENLETAQMDENGEMVEDIKQSSLYKIGETLRAYETLWYNEIDSLTENNNYTIKAVNKENITSPYTDVNGTPYIISEWGTADAKPVIQHYYNGDPTTSNDEYIEQLKKAEEDSNMSDFTEEDANTSSDSEPTTTEKMNEAKEHLLEAFTPFTENNYGKEVGRISNVKGVLAVANTYASVSSNKKFASRLFCEYATTLFCMSHTALPEDGSSQGESITVPLAAGEYFVDTTWLLKVTDDETTKTDGEASVTKAQAMNDILYPKIANNPLGGYTISVAKKSNGDYYIYNCENGCVTEKYYCNEKTVYKNEKTLCVVNGDSNSEKYFGKLVPYSSTGGCRKKITQYTNTKTAVIDSETKKSLEKERTPGTTEIAATAKDADGNTYKIGADGVSLGKLYVNKDAYKAGAYTVSYSGKSVQVKNSSGEIVNATLGVIKYKDVIESYCPGHEATLCAGHVDMCIESIVYQYDNVQNNLYNLSNQMALNTDSVDSFEQTSYKIAGKYDSFEDADPNELKVYSQTIDAVFNQNWAETYGYGIDLNNGASTLVAVAQREVGNLYSKYTSTPSNWCAKFVSYCLDEAGLIDAGCAFKDVSADFGIIDEPEKLLNLGATIFGPYGSSLTKNVYTNPTIPEPGDLVMFDWPNGNDYYIAHVGIVETVTYDPSLNKYKVTTIEGNTGDGLYVRRHSYYIGDNSYRGIGVKVYVRLKVN